MNTSARFRRPLTPASRCYSQGGRPRQRPAKRRNFRYVFFPPSLLYDSTNYKQQPSPRAIVTRVHHTCCEIQNAGTFTPPPSTSEGLALIQRVYVLTSRSDDNHALIRLGDLVWQPPSFWEPMIRTRHITPLICPPGNNVCNV
jgi:hypothetical protein